MSVFDPQSCGRRIPYSFKSNLRECDMTKAVLKRFDRLDENFARPHVQTHVTVRDDRRGELDLSGDRSQHRRYTALYNDLQN
jgi:hypothetical protein